MADTVETTETGSQPQVSNDTSTVTAPVSDNSNAELERLRKEKEQADMRANQLANELEARKKADADAQAKKLEEDGKLSEALELERAKSRRLEEEKESAERNALLQKETNEVLSKYSPAVVEIAQTAGLSLVDDSDEAKASLTEKLDSINAKVGGGSVSGNNPAPSVQQPQAKEELLAVMSNPDVRPRDRDKAAEAFAGSLETVKAMKAANGWQERTQ